MDPVTIGGIALGLGKTLFGFGKKNKAKAMASRNPRPVRKTSQAVLDNLDIAESMASQGLSDSAKAVYMENADRLTTASLEAVLRSGGDPNLAGSIYDMGLDNLSKFALAEDEARLKNIAVYMDANTAKAKEDDLNFQINEYAKWADTAQAAAKLSAEGTSEIAGGLGTAFSAAVSGIQAGTNPTSGGMTMAQRWGTAAKAYGMTTSGRPAPAQNTINLSPTPININYTKRSLNSLNSLGLKPLSVTPWYNQGDEYNYYGMGYGANPNAYFNPQ